MTGEASGPTPPLVPAEQFTSRFVTTLGRSTIAAEFADSLVTDPEKLAFDRSDIEGRVAFITGASGGIGRATALMLAENGARLAIQGRDRARTQETADMIARLGGETPVVIVEDMRHPVTVNSAVRTATERFGRIDIGVLNAGAIRDADPFEMSPRQWYDVAHVNGDVTFFTAQALAKQMIEQDDSVARNLVYVSSVAKMGNSGQVNYSFSKAGGEAIMESFARHPKMKDVNVGIIRPGLVATDMISGLDERTQRVLSMAMPSRRILTPQEVANGIGYLATRPDSGHILTLA